MATDLAKTALARAVAYLKQDTPKSWGTYVRADWSSVVLDGTWDTAEIAEKLAGILADVWDDGFTFGHYSGDEPRDCDCRDNPYRNT